MRKLFLVLLLVFSQLAHAAADQRVWFSRPELNPDGTAASTYGSENGTTYDDAWPGLGNNAGTSWVIDIDGILPGDTLFICGLHIGTYTDNVFFNPPDDWGGVYGNLINVRFDCPGDPGRISTRRWLCKTSDFVHQSDGIYKADTCNSQSPSSSYDYAYTVEGGKQHYVTSALTSGNPDGDFYFDSGNSDVYWKPECEVGGVEGDGPCYNLQLGAYDGLFVLKDHNDYIRVVGLDVRGASNDAITVGSSTGQQFIGGDVTMVKSIAFEAVVGSTYSSDGYYDCLFDSLMVHDVKQGFSFQPASTEINGCTFRDNWVYNSLDRATGVGDHHAFGMRASNFNDNTFQRNKIWDWDGHAFVLYTVAGGDQKRNLIEFNEIIDTVGDVSGDNSAFQIGGDSGSTNPRSHDNTADNVFRFNKIINVLDGAGYCSYSKVVGADTGVTWEFYGNEFRNCKFAPRYLRFSDSGGACSGACDDDPAGGLYHDNLFDVTLAAPDGQSFEDFSRFKFYRNTWVTTGNTYEWSETSSGDCSAVGGSHSSNKCTGLTFQGWQRLTGLGQQDRAIP